MPNPLILFEHELNRIDSHVANHKLEILGNLKYRENLLEFRINFLHLFLDDILDGQQLRIFAECQNKILVSHITNWCLIVLLDFISFLGLSYRNDSSIYGPVLLEVEMSVNCQIRYVSDEIAFVRENNHTHNCMSTRSQSRQFDIRRNS